MMKTCKWTAEEESPEARRFCRVKPGGRVFLARRGLRER